MARQTKKVIQEVNRETAEDAFAEYNACVSKLSILEGKLNGDITKVKEKYEGDISKLQEKRDEQFELLQCYAENNAELFEKKKSMEFTHGVIGFRKGTPVLKTLKGFTWEAIKTLIQNSKIWPSDFIRKKEEVNKELVIANREQDIVKSNLKGFGLMITNDETFYVAPKLEEVAMA